MSGNNSTSGGANSEASSVFDGGPLLPPGIGIFLLQISLILIVTRALGGVLKKMKQPSVVAEVLTGILLGPSAFGAIPGFLDTVFPASSLTAFKLVGNLGLVFYLFLVGLELEPKEVMATGRKALSIALAGIALPFLGGVLIAILFFHAILKKQEGGYDVSFTSLAVFTGVGMSITAFPVLARILAETKLIAVPVGTLTLSAAAFNDAVAWILLALAIAIVQSGPPITALYILLATIAFAAFLIVAVRPLLAMAVHTASRTHKRSWRAALLALVFVSIFLSGWVTQFLGLDAIFGAFLMGLILPREESIVKVVEKIEDVIMVVFLPVYFTLSGLSTDIFSIDRWSSVFILLLVLFVAIFGKIVGCTTAARYCGEPMRESLAIAVLMNTRGLVELIVLNLGLSAGVINVQVFTIMVLMAVITTCLTSPMIRLVYPKEIWASKMTEAVMDMALSRRNSPGYDATSFNDVTMLVPAEQSDSLISGIFTLLPGPPAPPVTLVVMVTTDSTSTSMVMNKRLGTITGSNAKALNLAARFFGAESEVKQVVVTTENVGPQLARLMREVDVRLCLLPWMPQGGGPIDYELSMWDAITKMDPTSACVLLRDEGLSLPRFVLGAVPGSQATPQYTVTVLLHDTEDEDAVLNIIARMRTRQDVQMSVISHRGVSQDTLLRLQRLQVQLQSADSEAELVVALTEKPINLLIYGYYGKPPPRRTKSPMSLLQGTSPRSEAPSHSHSHSHKRSLSDSSSFLASSLIDTDGVAHDGPDKEDLIREMVQRISELCRGDVFSVMEVHRGRGKPLAQVREETGQQVVTPSSNDSSEATTTANNTALGGTGDLRVIVSGARAVDI